MPTEPLPLHHSWPLFEHGLHFDTGLLHEDGIMMVPPAGSMFRCDLADNRVTWTAPVFRLFGFPEGDAPSRDDVLPLYDEGSRAALERLRAHAIRHRRGFTIDTELRPIDAPRRWVRITAMPECRDGRAVALAGWKQDVSHEYP